MRFERSQTDPISELIVDDVSAVADADGADVGPVVVACPDQLGVALQRQLDRRTGDAVDVVPFPTMGDARFVDWVDYGERNDAADPGAFAAELLATVPAEATIYVVSNPNYKDLRGQVRAAHRGPEHRA